MNILDLFLLGTSNIKHFHLPHSHFLSVIWKVVPPNKGSLKVVLMIFFHIGKFYFLSLV